MGCLVILAGAAVLCAEEPSSSIPGESGSLRSIRGFNEGILYLVRAYAMIDAPLIAQEQGKEYGTGLWTGVASVCPGVGQLINKEYLKGDTLLISTFVLSQNIKEARGEEESWKLSAPGRWAEGMRWIEGCIQGYAMMDAGFTARTTDPTYDRAFWIGASSVLPGVGQFINHDWWKGGGLLVGFILFDRLAGTFEGMAKNEQHASRPVPSRSGTPDFSLAFAPNGWVVGVSSRF
jgi:hypothetical protein